MASKTLDTLLPIGTRVKISFERGNSFVWFYAGTLTTKVGEREGHPPELLFTDTLAQVNSCRVERSYHKVTHSGYSAHCPGKRVFFYEILT
jgi:hypothetical protein